MTVVIDSSAVLAFVFEEPGGEIAFADRVCIALALEHRLPLVTADTDWLKLDLGLDLRLIR